VHGNVRGVDGARTNVVVVDELIKLRPDIVVAAIEAPSAVWTRTPTIVTATLREMNGDVGARATCVLDVDGEPMDSAADIWVDAGGTVSCAFAVLLEEPGAHVVTVRATSVTPRDWDLSNNAQSATVIVGRDLPLAYDASASDDSVVKWTMWSRDFTTGSNYHSADKDSSTTTGRTQSASMTAYTREPISFPEQPLRDVRLAQGTGTTTVHEATYDVLNADAITSGPNWISACVTRSDGAVVATFTLCSRRETIDGAATSFTSVSYRWNAGDVTYRSIGYSIVACPVPGSIPCVPSSYSWNTTTPSIQGRRVAFGADYAFDVELRSGLTQFRANPVLALTPTHAITQQWPSCQSMWGIYPPAGRYGFLTSCSAAREEHWRLSGSGWGL